MPKKRKQVTMLVTVSVPASCTAADARREVRSLINNQANYTDFVPGSGYADEMIVRAKQVRAVRA